MSRPTRIRNDLYVKKAAYAYSDQMQINLARAEQDQPTLKTLAGLSAHHVPQTEGYVLYKRGSYA
jgi:hypothetical protein